MPTHIYIENIQYDIHGTMTFFIHPTRLFTTVPQTHNSILPQGFSGDSSGMSHKYADRTGQLDVVLVIYSSQGPCDVQNIQ